MLLTSCRALCACITQVSSAYGGHMPVCALWMAQRYTGKISMSETRHAVLPGVLLCDAWAPATLPHRAHRAGFTSAWRGPAHPGVGLSPACCWARKPVLAIGCAAGSTQVCCPASEWARVCLDAGACCASCPVACCMALQLLTSCGTGVHMSGTPGDAAQPAAEVLWCLLVSSCLRLLRQQATCGSRRPGREPLCVVCVVWRHS
jgi:hypothetical protein